MLLVAFSRSANCGTRGAELARLSRLRDRIPGYAIELAPRAELVRRVANREASLSGAAWKRATATN